MGAVGLEPRTGRWARNCTERSQLIRPNVRSGSRPCENVFPPPKLHATRRDPRRRDPSEHIFAVSSLESIRAQPRATLSDLNGYTASTTVHAPHARIAARSGLIPTMFITRVRL